MNIVNIFFSRTFLKFLAAGASNTLLSAVIMFGLYNAAGRGYWFSSALAYLAGAALNFFLNKYFTFKVREWKIRAVVFFALTIAISYLIAYGAARPAVSFLLNGRDSKLRGNVSLLTGMCLYTFLNYIGQRFIVFRRHGMMGDYMENMERLFERQSFTGTCKKIIAVFAICGLAGGILLLFPPLTGVLAGIAERVKPITGTTWRSFFGSFGIFVMLFCGCVLYNLYSHKINDAVKTRLLGAFIAAILLVTTYMNFVYGRQWIDSEMASEMILGNLLAKENKLVTSSWVYSTELRLVYQQLFYMPLFKLFDNWHLVRTITILLNTIVLLASYFFMMRQFDVSKKTTLLASLFLILPVSYGYWSFVLFGGYYIFFIAMFFCYIGVSAILIKTDGQNTSIKKRNTAFIFFALLAFTFGLGGVRGPMDIQAPMFITALCVYFPQKNTVLNSKPFLLGIAGLLLCAVGYAINSVLHLFLHFAFQIGKDTVDLSGIFFQRLGDILYNFILFLGYTADVKFISAQGVLNFAVVIIAFLVFYEAIRIIKTRRANDVSALNVSFVLFFMVATVYHVVLFQIIEYISRYLYPTYILYVPTLAIVFEFVRKNMPRKKAAIFVSGIVFVILCSGMITLYSLPDIDNNNHRKSSISYLEENNLRFGFASLWNGNIITELTNGRIETLGLHPDNYHKMSGWLYPVAYRNPDYHTGETFLLLTRDEWQGDEKLLRRVPDYEDDYFVIFKYPSAAQVFEEIITEN